MYRLLIADDEMIERAVLYKRITERLGAQCEIFQASNGREALEIYEAAQIQIAILDIEMPGINGIEAAERIRARDKACCIIFLTAFDEFSYAKRAISVRALDYLLKPCDEKELMLVLEEAMHLADRYAEGQHPAEHPAAAAAGADERPPRNLEEIIMRYIDAHYMQDLSVQEIAAALNYSEPYFCKLFKQSFGQSFVSYLTEYRVNKAKEQLAQLTVNVKEVGKAVGYADSNYFAKVFKRITGQPPSEYRTHILHQP